ncbi:nuclear localization protein-like protein NPL6 [Cryomyces antarcticus]|nr:chromatin structure-remodeling complex subunit RSC7 [Cryomyces antarcticus]KAK5017636.1 chromatin structure-remodeling complex subunit RSC7 [Cryomyces antarcticus]
MPGRRGRGAARGMSNVMRTPTPAVQVSDEEMVDGDESQVATPQDEMGDEAPEEDEVGTPAPDSEAQDDDESAPPTVQSIPRKRRLGRPPRTKPHDWNTPEPGNEEGSDTGTPHRRRRGRPSGPGGWRGGFRGKPRGGPSHVTRVPIDKSGNTMEVIDDEVALPEDPEGETKVDKFGNLQGGRDYRVRVFNIIGRGDRLYMLSTEPARCTGFRDSYLFFTKHLQLFKIIIGDDEKRDLIARDIIPHSYKGRAIGVVTARSVFREFGARIIIGGRKIIDDYDVQAARARGDVEGELADPNDRLPPPGEPYNKNQYVAWHGASSVYHTGAPSVPMPNGKPVVGKRKTNITASNWQVEHARAASRFNSALTAARRANLDGIYDPHTNLMFYPTIMQPTHARWEQVAPEADAAASIAAGPSDTTNGADGTDHANTSSTTPQAATTTTIFPPMPPVVARNFAVTDTYYAAPPLPNLPTPGPSFTTELGGAPGLSSVPLDVLAALPPECRAAFEEAKAAEVQWTSGWSTEAQDGARGKLRISYSGLPV